MKWTNKILFEDSKQIVFYNKTHYEGAGGAGCWIGLNSWEQAGMNPDQYKLHLTRTGFEFKDFKLNTVLENK